jgi:hypothetical protein
MTNENEENLLTKNFWKVNPEKPETIDEYFNEVYSNKETYLKWVTEWKKILKQDEATMISYKKIMRQTHDNNTPSTQWNIITLKSKITQLLLVRVESKKHSNSKRLLEKSKKLELT